MMASLLSAWTTPLFLQRENLCCSRIPAAGYLQVQSRFQLPCSRQPAPRFMRTVDSPDKHKIGLVYASNVNPPNQGRDKEKEGSSTSSVSDGPPLATIFAGLVVFLLVCWVIGSIVMWLVGLVVSKPSS